MEKLVKDRVMLLAVSEGNSLFEYVSGLWNLWGEERLISAQFVLLAAEGGEAVASAIRIPFCKSAFPFVLRELSGSDQASACRITLHYFDRGQRGVPEKHQRTYQLTIVSSL